MSVINNIFMGSSISFIEEEHIELSLLHDLFEDNSNIDYFVEKGILQYLSRNKVKFIFVGAIVANKKVAYIYPKYVLREGNNKSFESGYYIKVIKKYVEYSARKAARRPVQEYLDDISLLMRTYDSLDSYFQKYGSFKESLSSFTKGHHGRVNWSRTIQTAMPVHVTGDPDGGISRLTSNAEGTSHHPGSRIAASEAVFYPAPVHHVTSQNEGIISSIFKKVLTLLASIISPLLDRPHPLSLQMRQDSVTALFLDLAERRPFYARVIAQQVSREFGQRRAVLSSLLAFLRAEASVLDGAIRNRAFAFGVKKFFSVWEDACIHAVAGERGSHQLAKIIWRSTNGSRTEYQNRIDAKISCSNSKILTIIDAKYYEIDSRLNEGSDQVEKIIPQHDIVKQFGYMLAYHLGTGTELKNIGSAFITPRVSDEHFSYMGQISFEDVNALNANEVAKIRPIGVFGVNPKRVFDAYIADSVVKELVDFVNESHDYLINTVSVKKSRVEYTVYLRKDDEGIKIIGSEGKSMIPWMNATEIKKALLGIRDRTVIKILTDMGKSLDTRSGEGYKIQTDEIISGTESAVRLLCGTNQKLRKSVSLKDWKPNLGIS